MTGTRPSAPEAPLEDMARRIRNEFAEMPGMQLTFEQVRRLCHLSREECAFVLHLLMAADLLAQDPHQRFRLREPQTRRSLAPSLGHLGRSA